MCEQRDARQPDRTERVRLARQFAFVFTKLLKALHQTFNGTPQAFDKAMGLMFELKLAGQKLCGQSIGGGQNAGPVFAYLTVPA